MSTIPIIFNESLPSYTAVGGSVRGASTGVSAILLNRGGRYPRRTLFKELEKSGFDYIISLEGPHDRYDLEELSGRFPFVRFILLKDQVSPGEQINLAVSELNSPLFFVLWNDLRILHGGDAAKISEWLRFSREELRKAPSGTRASGGTIRRLCTVPVMQNSGMETLPTIITPAFFRSTVKPLHFPPHGEAQPSLYPFDGVGLYDRDRFIKLGGFDSSINSTYYQLLDFGFRAHLWGEEIRSTQLIRLSYDGEAEAEDTTTDSNYRRFYLKNLAPVFHRDSAHIPISLFPAYFLKTGGEIGAAWGEFNRNRLWVRANRYRFRRDARILTSLWEHPGGMDDPGYFPPEDESFPGRIEFPGNSSGAGFSRGTPHSPGVPKP
ncbi:conserved hypothetical protein [Treponema primitia ZAS-2]|uniref:Uncharacterized protein n=1 Tax=Treponema primitia (strain ATCC BAA-887 / DSM 12427 / ZAS-2) TaxID=545694 RepID=F5YH40_TREPZ|nr:hypothetical protein [Treponema primitia]AEF85981.1 conserved hypothetical protein [Treponema primitia ZAS-2]